MEISSDFKNHSTNSALKTISHKARIRSVLVDTFQNYLINLHRLESAQANPWTIE